MPRAVSPDSAERRTDFCVIFVESFDPNTTYGVSYLRVSTKEQAERDGKPEGYSIPAQREFNQRKADSMGVVIAAEFIDRGESARSANRPGLQAMLPYIQQHPISYAYVHKVDRLARNRADDVEITLSLRQAGAQLVSATENIDETPSGMLLHGIMSSIAEFYSQNLAAEVIKGLTQKVRKGGTPGRAPIGYLNTQTGMSESGLVRSVITDPVRGPIVKWAFEAYATGDWSTRTLLKEVAARGLTTVAGPRTPSKLLALSQLTRILRNPYYIGEIHYNGVVYEGRHPALVSREVFERVQAILSTKANGEKLRSHPHYLKSTVRCGRCESRLIVTKSKNRWGTVYPYSFASVVIRSAPTVASRRCVSRQSKSWSAGTTAGCGSVERCARPCVSSSTARSPSSRANAGSVVLNSNSSNNSSSTSGRSSYRLTTPAQSLSTCCNPSRAVWLVHSIASGTD
jgi:DNA invertase Pin-like site-specific DNA recombinase